MLDSHNFQSIARHEQMPRHVKVVVKPKNFSGPYYRDMWPSTLSPMQSARVDLILLLLGLRGKENFCAIG